MSGTSTKPYLIRAIHEWCSDNGYRPFIAVSVDERTQVPPEFVRDGEIVLNVAPHATNRLRIGNDLIEFEARFNGVVRQIAIPVENVSAIYAAENGEGMAFDVARDGAPAGDERGEPDAVEQASPPAAPLAPVPLREAPLAPSDAKPPEPPSPGKPPKRPTLTRVK